MPESSEEPILGVQDAATRGCLFAGNGTPQVLEASLHIAKHYFDLNAGARSKKLLELRVELGLVGDALPWDSQPMWVNAIVQAHRVVVLELEGCASWRSVKISPYMFMQKLTPCCRKVFVALVEAVRVPRVEVEQQGWVAT